MMDWSYTQQDVLSFWVEYIKLEILKLDEAKAVNRHVKTRLMCWKYSVEQDRIYFRFYFEQKNWSSAI
jgi:hypothetical protein